MMEKLFARLASWSSYFLDLPQAIFASTLVVSITAAFVTLMVLVLVACLV
jgi:hypothetical protein